MIYSIKGTVVNSQSQDPIKGAKVKISPLKFVSTDTNGNFTITGNIPESGSLSMTINAVGYQFIEPPLYKGDGTLKPDLGVLQLQPLVSSLAQDKIKSSQLSKNQIKEISKGKKDLSYYAEEKLSNQVNTLKNTLIPTVLTMVAAFGVTQISQTISDQSSNIPPDKLKKILDNSSCPTQAELTNLINRKNKLVKQLNNSLKIIDTTTKVLGITGGIIQALQIALKLQVAIPTPVPPAVNEANRILDKRISQLKSVNTGILSILLILRQVLTQALQLLNLLDQLVQKCYPNADQERVSLELTALTVQQSTQLSPVVTNVNGFEMGVETENTTNTLKRRRAIARNKQGVVMLKGEWSFSSIDQILIDELVFYIQQNDLKAD
jgi:hypothetical protein